MGYTDQVLSVSYWTTFPEGGVVGTVSKASHTHTEVVPEGQAFEPSSLAFCMDSQ